MSLRVTTVHHAPQTHPAPELADFADLERRAMVATYGDDDLATALQVLTVSFAEQAQRRKLVVVAYDDTHGRAVGGFYVMMPVQDNTSVAEMVLSVDPRQAAGETVPALWEHLRPHLREEGRRSARVMCGHAVDPEAEQLVPRTGVGSLSRDPVAAALQDLGFTLEQVERHSILHVDEALRLAAGELPAAREAAGTAYRTLGWVGPTPEERREGMARLMARMSTDAPSGELDVEPEVWDAERVAELDRVHARTGLTTVATVAEHVATGELVAYTFIGLPADKPSIGYQQDTLVHADHRGHRLGMLVKAENLQRLAAHAPALERLHTWNAGENAHMLAINVALGFRPVSSEGLWQLTGV